MERMSVGLNLEAKVVKCRPHSLEKRKATIHVCKSANQPNGTIQISNSESCGLALVIRTSPRILKNCTWPIPWRNVPLDTRGLSHTLLSSVS